jgi:hypothetical protein
MEYTKRRIWKFNLIADSEFEEFDILNYEVENKLLERVLKMPKTQTSCSRRTNASRREIGPRPELGPKLLTVLPLPRGEGWGEGNSVSRSFNQSGVQSLVLSLLLVLDRFFRHALRSHRVARGQTRFARLVRHAPPPIHQSTNPCVK